MDSAFFIYIDHVREIIVHEGDTIKAGDVIGLSGEDPEYRVELQVNYMHAVDSDSFGTTHYCPLDYGTQEFVDAHLAFASLSDWKLRNEIDGGVYK
jgi:pyruvate/2-oxoglutarate dehydrogenase complex dihydrolipoamide acyltransferase (E2) component